MDEADCPENRALPPHMGFRCSTSRCPAKLAPLGSVGDFTDGDIMKTILVAAAALSLSSLVAPVVAQQGRPVTQEEIATAQALFEQMQGACAAGSKNKACGVLVYSPKDCTAKKKDGHSRQIYNTYEDRTVRFQQANTGVARQRPMALLAPFGIIGRDGKSTRFAGPQFVSWDEYQGGKKSVTVCGQSFRLEAKDFTIEKTMENFLKANP